jgi:hypothetical protein
MTPETKPRQKTAHHTKAHRIEPLLLALRRVLAIVLIATVGPVAPLLAQVSSATAQAGAPQSLHITILDGEDAINNIRERTAREPIVQVEDENHKPVAGALILFTIQGGPNGAGATFNGLNTLSVTTDAEGKATAHGLKPNETQGSYSITVSATVGMVVATAIIKQANAVGGGGAAAAPPTAPPPTPGSTAASTATRGGRLGGVFKSPWLFGAIGVVVVTVAVRTVIVGGHNPTSITPGNGTVGAP